MRKVIRGLVAALFLAAASLAIKEAPASASGAAYCANGWWYVHGTYPVGGGMWSWATCVPWGTAEPPYPDAHLDGSVGIIEVHEQVYISGAWRDKAVNYESSRTVYPYTDTVIAASSGCSSGVSYRTWLWVIVPNGGYSEAYTPHDFGNVRC